MKSHEVIYGICSSRDQCGYLGVKLQQSTNRIISEHTGSEGLGPIYVDSVKERTVPKIQVEEKFCRMGVVPPSMAFKEKEFPDTLLTTKGPMGETSEGVWQILGTRFTQLIHPSYTHQLKVETPAKYSGQK